MLCHVYLQAGGQRVGCGLLANVIDRELYDWGFVKLSF